MTKGLHKNSLRKVDNPHQWMIDDARMELIQQIKAEVERLKQEIYPVKVGEQLVNRGPKEEKPTIQEQPVSEDVSKEKSLSLQIQAYLNTCSDELYAEGKPLYSEYRQKEIHDCMAMWKKLHDNYFYNKSFHPVSEGLEEEIEEYCYKPFYEVESVMSCLSVEELADIARHFYELGRQSKSILSDDLEKATREYAMDDFYNGYSSGSIIEDTMKNFKAGAEWGAEHRGSSETPKDQDIVEASEKYAGELYGYELKSNEDLQKVIVCICGFKAGAKWQAERILEHVKLAYGKVSMNPFDCSEAFEELIDKINAL